MSFLFALAVAFSLFFSGFANAPVAEAAPTATIDIAALSAGNAGTGWRFDGSSLTLLDGADVAVTGSYQGLRRIEIAADAQVSLTLSAIDLKTTGVVAEEELPGDYFESRATQPLILKPGSNLTLQLTGNNVLENGPGAASANVKSLGAIAICENASLNLIGSGSLNAKGGVRAYPSYAENAILNIASGSLSTEQGIGSPLMRLSEINIAGGEIDTLAGGRSSHGIVTESLNVSGGLFKARSDDGISDVSAEESIITGGSVDVRHFTEQPTNGIDAVYRTAVVVGHDRQRNKSVSSLSLSSGGYGSADLVTDNAGKLFLWLPASGSNCGISIVMTDGDANPYTATVLVAPDNQSSVVALGNLEALPIPSGSNTIDIETVSPGTSETDWEYDGTTLSVYAGASVILTGSSDQVRVWIEPGSTATVTLVNVSMDQKSTGSSPIGLADGADLHLILADDSENLLYGGLDRAAVQGAAGSDIRISGESEGTGKLTVKNSGKAACIGSGNTGQSTGNITIEDCNIVADPYNNSKFSEVNAIGAGVTNSPCGDISLLNANIFTKTRIGAGFENSASGDILISGGSIEFFPHEMQLNGVGLTEYYAIGIGGGYDNSPCGDITIEQGAVVDGVTKASSSWYQTMLGAGGSSSPCGDITIEDSRVSLRLLLPGYTDAGGIGGGYNNSPCGAIVLRNSFVEAELCDVSSCGAAIGGGYMTSSGAILIDGGEVIASNGADSRSDGYANYASSSAIGSGYGANLVGNVEIRAGRVTAYSGTSDPAIGVGNASSIEGKLIISGGIVNATSLGGAAIGTPKSYSAALIRDGVEISGGLITATGGKGWDWDSSRMAAGIGSSGSGNYNSTPAITITGGTITAKAGGDDAQDIGSGTEVNPADDGFVQIDGGSVYAVNGRVGTTGDAGSITPAKNAAGEDLTCATFDFGPNIAADVAVTGASMAGSAIVPGAVSTMDLSGYGINDVVTQGYGTQDGGAADPSHGTLYFWLPAASLSTVDITTEQGMTYGLRATPVAHTAASPAIETLVQTLIPTTLSVSGDGSLEAEVLGVAYTQTAPMPQTTFDVEKGDTLNLKLSPAAGNLASLKVNGQLYPLTPAGAGGYTATLVAGADAAASYLVQATFYAPLQPGDPATGPYTIDARAGVGGSLSIADGFLQNVAVPAGASYSLVVLKGTNLQITATPAAGYSLKSLKLDGAPWSGASGEAPFVTTLANIEANHRLEAEFVSLATPPYPDGAGDSPGKGGTSGKSGNTGDSAGLSLVGAFAVIGLVILLFLRAKLRKAYKGAS